MVMMYDGEEVENRNSMERVVAMIGILVVSVYLIAGMSGMI
jgi:hypothetical protein